jgi:hypothetical protein
MDICGLRQKPEVMYASGLQCKHHLHPQVMAGLLLTAHMQQQDQWHVIANVLLLPR